MNIIFLTLCNVNIESRGIYNDLMRKFRNEGHNVYIVHPNERRAEYITELTYENGIHRLGVKSLNIQKTNIIEKGISTLLLEYILLKAINKHLSTVYFDLILYSTPPVTFAKIIKRLKAAHPKAKAYLLLKDIFPQNAIDINLLSKRNPIYWYFRSKEKALYKASDYIGCMSPANMQYILKHNNYIPKSKVGIAPNSIEIVENAPCNKDEVRLKYGLPTSIPIFLYGGNLGKPQGIEYLIKCLEANKERLDCHFMIIGSGTEFNKLKQWKENETPQNLSLFSSLPKNDYDQLVQSCDVGLIFLDYRFSIPNFPSRLLSYLENKLPVIAATDKNTDLGAIIQDNNFGFWCESVKPEDFTRIIDQYIKHPELIKEHGNNGYNHLLNNYLINNTYSAITKSIL